MALVDSHCHINFPDLAERIPEVIANAERAGVQYMLCVAVDLEHHEEILSLAQAHDRIFASVGKHPNERDGEEPDVQRLVDLAQSSRVVAIGETGLDYFRSQDDDMTWQRERFETHIQAAHKVNKPIIVHSREAPEDTVSVLAQGNAGDVGVVMHCFAGDWAMAKACLDIGCYISFSGIVTFKTADVLRDVAQRVPLDRILVETDCPYLAPVPKRGKTNEPAFVRYTSDFIAEMRGMSSEAFDEQTTENFFTLFAGAERVQSAH